MVGSAVPAQSQNVAGRLERSTGRVAEVLPHPPQALAYRDDGPGDFVLSVGRLDRKYGDSAFYVHLTRDVGPVAASWAKRAHTGMMNAYRYAILWHCPKDATPVDVALDYCDTVAENIRLFLRDKKNWMAFPLEEGRERFPEFWRRIGAEGSLAAALAEFDVRHNAAWDRRPEVAPGLLKRIGSKLYRIGRKLPVFLRNA